MSQTTVSSIAARVTVNGDSHTVRVTADRQAVSIVAAQQGPPGPPGDSGLPDPDTLADGRMIAVQDGEYIDIAPPGGTGDMQTLVYDPRGFATDAFNLSNLTGSIDGGVFT